MLLFRNDINSRVSWENDDPEINQRHWFQPKATWPWVTSRREMFALMCEIEMKQTSKQCVIAVMKII